MMNIINIFVNIIDYILKPIDTGILFINDLSSIESLNKIILKIAKTMSIT